MHIGCTYVEVNMTEDLNPDQSIEEIRQEIFEISHQIEEKKKELNESPDDEEIKDELNELQVDRNLLWRRLKRIEARNAK